MPYATVDEVLNRMGHAGAVSVDLSARITDALDAATSRIDLDTGRTFTVSSGARTFVTPGAEHELMLPDFTAVTTVKVDDDDDGTFETTIAASGYELDKVSVRADWPFDTIRLLDRCWPYSGRRLRRVEVNASWGWAAVPAPINAACALMAARLAQRTTAALFGTQSFGELGAASIRSQDPDYVELIQPYRVAMVL